MAGPDAFNAWFNIITDSTAELLESTTALLQREHSPSEHAGLLELQGHIRRARAHFADQSSAYLQWWLEKPPQQQRQPTRAVWVRRGVNHSTDPHWIAARLQQLMTWSDASFAIIYARRQSQT